MATKTSKGQKYMIPQSIWKKNPLTKIVKGVTISIKSEEMIVQKIPDGKIIEIVYDPFSKEVSKFKFSYNSSNEAFINIEIGDIITKTYSKLEKIAKEFNYQKTHFYGFIDINKEYFYGLDIYVNANWIDWNLVEAFYQEAGVNTPLILYMGNIKEFDIKKEKEFILRPIYELPEKRYIYYYSSKTLFVD